MAHQIYDKKGYKIYQVGKSDFIVHNSKRNTHTHIKNFNTAKNIIIAALTNRLPKSFETNKYLLTSVYRISDNEEFKSYIKKLLESHNSK